MQVEPEVDEGTVTLTEAIRKGTAPWRKPANTPAFGPGKP